MPRVTTVIARRQKPTSEPRSCQRCDKPIEVGQEIHKWSFRYGGPRYQHAEHGYPRASQLTQSKLSAVYAATEEADDALDLIAPDAGDFDADNLGSDLQQIVASVAEVVREVEQEYRDALDAFEHGNSQFEEWADELDSWANDLESWTLDTEPPDPAEVAQQHHIQSKTPSPDTGEQAWVEALAEWVEAAVDEARDLVNACPI